MLRSDASEATHDGKAKLGWVRGLCEVHTVSFWLQPQKICWELRAVLEKCGTWHQHPLLLGYLHVALAVDLDKELMRKTINLQEYLAPGFQFFLSLLRGMGDTPRGFDLSERLGTVAH